MAQQCHRPCAESSHSPQEALPVVERGFLNREYVAPRTRLEEKLVHTWESMLGTAPIGINDNIFELGVDSVLAARLFARIQKALRFDLPPTLFFRAPTVESLARLIESREGTPPEWTSLVPVKPHGEKTPLFCVHGGAGTVLFYHALGARLVARPLYAFQAQGLYGRDLPISNVEAMAAHYIAEMRTVQPHGPYLLGAWCFGGIVAFEMAQQLLRTGERVDMLAMLNAPSAPEYEFHPSDAELAPMAERLTARWQEFRGLSLRQKLIYLERKVAGQLTWRLQNLRNHGARFFARKTIPIRHRIYRYFEQRRRPLPDYIRNKYFLYVHSRAERLYKHQAYAGSMVVFRDQQPYPEASLGWSRFTRDIEVHEIPVGVKHHRGLLQEPAVGLLAVKIEEYLSRRASFHATVGDAA